MIDSDTKDECNSPQWNQFQSVFCLERIKISLKVLHFGFKPPPEGFLRPLVSIAI